MNQLSFISITFSFLFFGCATKTAVTKEFETYMATVVNTSPVNGTAYLFVPDNQCKGCVMLNADKMPDQFNKRIQVCSSFEQKQFKNFQHYFYDQEDHLLELKLVDYENKLVIYDHNQVMVIRNVQVSPYGSANTASCKRD